MHLKIFLLQFKEVIEDRSRIVVWFLLAAITPLILILFWRGASHINGWTSNQITCYYLFAIVVYASIMCHQEEHIATRDIQEGGLTAYLLKPFSYLQLLFWNELSYRLFQGVIGGVLLGVFVFFAPKLFAFVSQNELIALSVIIFVLAFLLSFIFKMVVGVLAFWMTETRGVFEAVDVLIVIFSGTLMPVAFLPQWLQTFANALPFPYMVNFPVVAFEGKLTLNDCWNVIIIQILWTGVLYLIYKVLWKYGIMKYTAVGQ